VTSYVVTALVRPVRPRIREQQRPGEPIARTDAEDRLPAVVARNELAASHLDGLARGIGETMFYLLSPESWR
jgi:hypothetical protein